MDLMVPAPGPSLRDRIRRWLGIESDSAALDEILELVRGQRRDFDELGRVLELKDRDARRVAEQAGALERIMFQIVEQGNRTAGFVQELQSLLRAYERNVPAIAKVKRAIDEKAKRDLAQAKKWALAAIRTNGGTSQETWPFGPAPAATCPKSEQGHLWQLVALFDQLEPPVPTVRCAHCEWKWTRDWTGPELARFLASQSEATRAKLEPWLATAPTAPYYADEQPLSIALVREAEADAVSSNETADDLDEAELLRDDREDLEARDDAALKALEPPDLPADPAAP